MNPGILTAPATGPCYEINIFGCSNSPTPTDTPTFTCTSTATSTPIGTGSNTPTNTPTPTQTNTTTPTSTSTFSNTSTFTLTRTITNTPTQTPTFSTTFTPTITSTTADTPTLTPSQTPLTEDQFYVSKNIFNPEQESVSIYVALTDFSAEYNLRIYNTAGEYIRALDEQYLSGIYEKSYLWDGKNAHRDKCASGVYLIRLSIPSYIRYKKVLLIR
jgi:hypothetical protein